ncbi:ATP-binding protein [Vibrio vulnificus]|nr:ATP-binding protein [Vibrio vulnificus]
MKLVWLHGAPAAGKLTVAKVLHEKYRYKLFHNHLTVDLSLSIYESFGEKDFIAFTNQIRRTVLAKAHEIGVTHLVMTSMTCSESDAEEVNQYLEFFTAEGIIVFPIHLNPTKEELYERSTSCDRVNSHKLSCQEAMAKVLTDMKFNAIAHEHSLSIDNTVLSAGDVAKLIAAHVS